MTVELVRIDVASYRNPLGETPAQRIASYMAGEYLAVPIATLGNVASEAKQEAKRRSETRKGRSLSDRAAEARDRQASRETATAMYAGVNTFGLDVSIMFAICWRRVSRWLLDTSKIRNDVGDVFNASYIILLQGYYVAKGKRVSVERTLDGWRKACKFAARREYRYLRQLPRVPMTGETQATWNEPAHSGTGKFPVRKMVSTKGSRAGQVAQEGKLSADLAAVKEMVQEETTLTNLIETLVVGVSNATLVAKLQAIMRHKRCKVEKYCPVKLTTFEKDKLTQLVERASLPNKDRK